MKFVGVAVIGVCALLAVCASAARATSAPGNSIANALAVTAGVHEDGSTALFPDNCGNQFEYWELQLQQGDKVTIAWGSPPAVDTLALWAPGTIDGDNDGCLYAAGASVWSHWTTSPVLSDSSGTLTTVATEDGSYPLLFLDTTGAGAGEYSFTATVLHAASVSFAHQSKIPGAGTFVADVKAPDSSPISDSGLKLTLNGYWGNRTHKLGTATPVGGLVAFNYSLPASEWGKEIRLGISGGGPSYQAVASEKESVKVLTPTGVPVLASASELKTASKLLRQPIYWAGPQKGYHYEFLRNTLGDVYVRYLPRGVHAGDHRPKFLIVATYPYPGAYASLKKFAHGKASSGPGGSIYYPLPPQRKSVYVAWPKVNFEVEVYDPKPAVSLKIAATGQVRPVR